MIARYTRPEMAELWSLESRYRAWLEVELAVCEAWHEQGVISVEDMAAIRDKAAINVDRIEEIEATTRHDVIAFLTSLEEKIGPAARFIHLGCTSSDIVDSAGALLLVRAGERLLEDFDLVLDALKKFSLGHKGLICMGRTHGIHAEPTTYALKFAGFHAEFQRHRERFAAAVEDIRVGKISGAVGTYAFLSPDIERRACEILGLKPDTISTQIIQRDRYAHYFTSLAVAGGGIERLCTELRHLQRTEVHEVEEGFAKGQKGSSAMPHKRNPITAERVCGLARVVKANAQVAFDNVALWFERDISHSGAERVVLADSFTALDYMFAKMQWMLDGLQTYPAKMEHNLWRTRGLIFSSKVLLALVDAGITREDAYVIVQRNAMKVWEDIQNAVDGPTYRERLEADDEAAALLTAEKLDEIFDPWDFLTRKDVVFDRLQELEF